MEDEPDIVEYPDSDGEVQGPEDLLNDIPKDAVWLDAETHVHVFDLRLLHSQKPLTRLEQGRSSQLKPLLSVSSKERSG